MHRHLRAAGTSAFMATILLWTGCSGGISLLNPDFVASLGGSQKVASVPGDAPALLVTVDNRTDQVVLAQLSYRTTDSGVQNTTSYLQANSSTAEALICPIDELTLGDVGDAKAVGARILLGNQSTDSPYLEVDPFGVIMKEGVNYDCGDSVTFAIERSSATSSGYQIFAFIRRASGG